MKKFLVALATILALAAGNVNGAWPEIAQTWHEIQNGAIPYTNPATNTLDIRPGSFFANNVTATALATPGAITVTPVLTKIGSITTVGSGAFATGSITTAAPADLVDGETITLSDGVNAPGVFEFEKASDGVSGANVAIDITAAASAGDVADAIAAALNTYVGSSLKIGVSHSPGDTGVYLTANLIGATPNVAITSTVASGNFSVSGMTGGADGVADGDYFTIKYATGLTVSIEFDAAPGNGTTGGRVPYVFAQGDTADAIRDGLIVLLNGAAGTALTASSGGAATVSLVLDTPGAAGDTNTENVANAGFAVTGFVNPTAATTYGYVAVSYLADGTSTAASAEVTTAAGHATLSASNFNTVVFAPSPGSTSTRLYRKTGGVGAPRLLYTGTATSYVDTGAAGTAETPNTVNTTGRVLAGPGSASAPAYTTAATPGSGLYFSGAGTPLVAVGGTLYYTFGANGFTVSNGVLNLSALTMITPAAATLQLGAAAANSDGVDQRLQTQGGITGTDRAAGDLDLTTGLGTGTGYSKVTISAPTRVGTGTTAQTRATLLTVSDLGVQWMTGTRPTCDAASRGSVWYVAGGAGVADTFEVCRKDAANAYAWVTLY